MGSCRRVVSTLKDTLCEELEELSEAEIKITQYEYVVDVTPDTGTANPNVDVSVDGMQARLGDIEQR